MSSEWDGVELFSIQFTIMLFHTKEENNELWICCLLLTLWHASWHLNRWRPRPDRFYLALVFLLFQLQRVRRASCCVHSCPAVRDFNYNPELHTHVWCVYPSSIHVLGSQLLHTHTHFAHLNVVNLSSRSCRRGCFSVLMQQPDSLCSVCFFCSFFCMCVFVFRWVCVFKPLCVSDCIVCVCVCVDTHTHTHTPSCVPGIRGRAWWEEKKRDPLPYPRATQVTGG